MSKLQKLAEKQREQKGMLLEQMKRHVDHYQRQLDALGELQSGCASVAQGKGACNSMILNNTIEAQAMLNGALRHHRHEKAILDAEYEFSRKQLQASHIRVKYLEQVTERWKKKQQYENAKKEQKRIEDIINARSKHGLI
ncbi:flagellar export protein FliJ [Vibrio sp. HA2012]|uniref:flagellar export protein FliJ n=1 Tax=Vibrio sp. HA2012 TaxID=1971595 RepID=UPI0012FE050A|nr:flagellar export protein FliJ [Vibrio sp. HA2012]